MAMERLHILVPKGTIKRLKRAAKGAKMETHSEWLRAIIKGVLEGVEAKS